MTTHTILTPTTADTFLTEWNDLASELASKTGLPLEQHLDEAFDLLVAMDAFAHLWDLCAISQGHPGDHNER